MNNWKRKLSVTALCAVLLASAGNFSVYAEGDNGGGTPPDMPDGNGGPGGDGGTPPDKPDGEGGGFGGGANTMTYDYSGEVSGAIEADGTENSASNETITSDTADVNAALSENGGTLTLDGVTLEKSGDDTDGDNCNFYGINSISLTVGEGSTTVIKDSTLNAASEGSNAVFATDSGTAYIYNSTITTSADNSRGLDATYSGTVIGDSLNISTQGDHCATLATDRGGGNVSLTNSTLSTAGSGSPLLYSTGDIEVDNVTGTATGSQIAGMEGLNTIIILNSDLTSTVTGKTASDPVADAVIIYQSTSGDAETSTGEKALFQAVDSTLTSAITSGAFFYVTNTTADIYLSGTELNYDSDAADLIYIAGNDANSWGTAGSNGGDVVFTLSDETVSGDVTVDTISVLDMYLLDGTTWTGSAGIETNSNGSTSDSPITINVDSSSKWVVTENSTISSLNVEDGGQIVDESGKTVSIVVNGETVVTGDSDITVTVTGSYSTTVTTTSENEMTTDYIDRSEFDSTYGTDTEFGSNTEEETSDTVKMYRLYNPNSGEHFYTSSKEEKNVLIKAGWTYEGVGWIAPTESDTPVYRLYNQNAGEHHYTTSKEEMEALVEAGWTYEGIGWYSDDDETVAVYRDYNPNQYANNHNYTVDANEHSYLDSIGWTDEGIGWYAVSAS